MPHLHIQIEEWQQSALADLARTRGVAVETVAESLLHERLNEQVDAACSRLLRRASNRRASQDRLADTLEARLKQLFDD